MLTGDWNWTQVTNLERIKTMQIHHIVSCHLSRVSSTFFSSCHSITTRIGKRRSKNNHANIHYFLTYRQYAKFLKPMSTLNNASEYSLLLEQYRQSGDICTYLGVNFLSVNLADRFAAFEAAGFHLSSPYSSILELLIPHSIIRQFIVARCSYEDQLLLFNNSVAQETVASMESLGRYPVISDLVLPSSMAILAILLNISLVIVTARKISMSTVCIWLLVFDSLCQIPAVLTFTVNLVTFYAGYRAVDYNFCLVSLFLSTGFSYASFLAVYFMSLERLLILIVIMPMRVSQLSEKTIKRCSLLAILACTCFGVVTILILYNVRIDITASSYGRFLLCNTFVRAKTVNVDKYASPTILGLALLNYVLIAGLIVWRRIYVPSRQTDLHISSHIVNS